MDSVDDPPLYFEHSVVWSDGGLLENQCTSPNRGTGLASQSDIPELSLSRTSEIHVERKTNISLHHFEAGK